MRTHLVCTDREEQITQVRMPIQTPSSTSDSDESLRAAILAELAGDEYTAEENLHVGVMNGIVHLAGAVDSLGKRAAAEGIAQRMDGVRGVVNRIAAPGAPDPAREINLDLKNIL